MATTKGEKWNQLEEAKLPEKLLAEKADRAKKRHLWSHPKKSINTSLPQRILYLRPSRSSSSSRSHQVSCFSAQKMFQSTIQRAVKPVSEATDLLDPQRAKTQAEIAAIGRVNDAKIYATETESRIGSALWVRRMKRGSSGKKGSRWWERRGTGRKIAEVEARMGSSGSRDCRN
jgi:hypothetical protein